MVNEIDLAECVNKIARFSGKQLALRIANLEYRFEGATKEKLSAAIADEHINGSVLRAALALKRTVSQIDVVIHALGILALLPSVLEAGEIVESLSLGAGSSEAKRFDVETNQRIAEFTFIEWQGNDNTRLQKVFKDFFRLAECETKKIKELWLSDDQYVLNYLQSKTSLYSATHKHRNVWEEFQQKYPKLRTVHEYYRIRASEVRLRVYDRELNPDWLRPQD